MSVYDIGDVVGLQGVFKKRDPDTGELELADPSTIEVVVQKPDGTTTTYTLADAQVVQDSLGTFHVDVDMDQEGVWVHSWEGAGNVKTYQEQTFRVRPRKIPV